MKNKRYGVLYLDSESILRVQYYIVLKNRIHSMGWQLFYTKERAKASIVEWQKNGTNLKTEKWNAKKEVWQ